MSTILELPKMPASVVLEPPLSDEEFEELCAANEFVRLERTTEGAIQLNAPAGADTSSGNNEISYQLTVWWKQHRRGRVFDSGAGFFLPDGSSLNPDAAHATADQMRGLTRKDRQHFLYLTPAFVVELLSFSDRLPTARKKLESKMEIWIANGAQLGWLIDPYQRKVLVYEPGQPVRIETARQIAGTVPVAGFVLDLDAVSSLYED